MKRLIAFIGLALLVITGASAADSPLTKVSETESTVTYSYPAVQGAGGYRYYADGQAVSRTFNPSQLTVRFAKGAAQYRVVPMDVSERADGFVDPMPVAPPPPPQPTTITSSECSSRASVNGAVLDNVTVTGNCTITADNVMISNSSIQGTIYLNASASGTTIKDSSAVAFESRGSDRATITGNVFDGGPGKSCQNFIWAGQPGDGSDGWTITGNTFQNYQCSNPHSEALFIGGYTANVRIAGNTFYNNGNTGDIFVSWCTPNDCDGTGGRYDGDPRDPHNICITGNTFKDTWEAYFHIVIRQEWTSAFGSPMAPNGHGIYTDDNIVFDPNQPFSTHATDNGAMIQLYDSDPIHGNSWAVGTC